MDKKSISLCMIVKNEEAKISRCLKSIKDFVDEIIIVDTGSADRTKEIVRGFDVKLFDYKWNDHFADARNFSLSHSTSDWNIVLDADEYVSNWSIDQVNSFLQNDHIGKIKVVDKFHSDGEINFLHSYISRLFPKEINYTGRIHEQINSPLPRINVPIEIQHDGYYLTDKSERNLNLLKQELDIESNNPYLLYQIAREYRNRGEHSLSYQHFRTSYQLLTKKESYAPNVIVDYLYSMIDSRNFDEGLELIQNEETFLSDFPDFYFVSGLLFTDLIMCDTQRYIHLLPQIEKFYRKAIDIGETDKYSSVKGTGSYATWYNLGVFYEVSGRKSDAIYCYTKAADYKYDKAIKRIEMIN